MEFPEISVIIPTYNRPSIVEQAVSLLQSNLVYSGKIVYMVGDDGSQKPSFDSSVVYIEGPKAGFGANVNNMLRLATSNYYIQLDDDHLLLKKLNLDDHVNKLESDKTSGWIRLMGVGYHRYTANLDGDYWRISWDSPELYIPSNRPHLKHKRFHDMFGLYPTGLKLGMTEESFCHNCIDLARQMENPLSVLVPIKTDTEGSWDHVGDSWQFKGL